MRGIREFIYEEEGLAVVEIILILVIVIGLVIIFKSKLTTLTTDIFKKINTDAGKIIK